MGGSRLGGTTNYQGRGTHPTLATKLLFAGPTITVTGIHYGAAVCVGRLTVGFVWLWINLIYKVLVFGCLLSLVVSYRHNRPGLRVMHMEASPVDEHCGEEGGSGVAGNGVGIGGGKSMNYAWDMSGNGQTNDGGIHPMIRTNTIPQPIKYPVVPRPMVLQCFSPFRVHHRRAQLYRRVHASTPQDALLSRASKH